MCSRINSFPTEILTIISQDLDQDDLLSCILVCKEWSTAFYSALFRNIRVSLSGYHKFTLPDTIYLAAKYSKYINSIDAPFPSFVLPLLDALATVHAEPFFPNLKSLSITFDHDIHLSYMRLLPQPQFFYPSDYEDMSDSDDEAMEYENNNIDSPPNIEDPTKGVYSPLFAPLHRVRDNAYLTQDPYDVIRLIRQCPNLCYLKIQVRSLGNKGGLIHLLWPGILPQSLVRLKIVVPEYWKEEVFAASDFGDDDYDPDMYPSRDVEEEYEDDQDEQDEDQSEEQNDGYDENEVVEWYLTQLQGLQTPADHQGPVPSIHFSFIRGNPFGDAPMQPLLNLREIEVNNGACIKSLIQKFMTISCPHLHAISLIDSSYFFSGYVGHMNEGIMPELTELRIENMDELSHFNENNMRGALSFSRWKSIVLRDFYFVGDLCTGPLVARAETLEVLDLGVNAGSMQNWLIIGFLAAASQLKALLGDGFYFLAKFACQRPWACSNTIEVLRCQILLEIPLVDYSIEPPQPYTIFIEEEQEDEYQRAEMLQQRVMRQLGRCHQLQELDLSHWTPDNYAIRAPNGIVTVAFGLMANRGPDFRRSFNMDPSDFGPIDANVKRPWTMKSQNNCLQFTFETGLRELEGLKKLRKLNLTGLKHRISVEELKWMREAWPNLEQFEGLFSNDMVFEDDGDGDEDRDNRGIREEEMRQWLQGGEVIAGDNTFWKTLLRM
ncbi:hypothetical protein BGX27_009752 [Mortierella sp. AM989]|nr:hypothetical protein BGX27_009752 [Mortierella sp. AM989]